MRRPLSTSHGILLAVLLLLTLGCEQVTRSGYRKLGAYEPRQLIRLDIGQMRVAFLHGARARVDSDRTALIFTASLDDETSETYRIPASVIVESPSVPGLPPAGKEQTWTVMTLRERDLSLARPLGYIYLHLRKDRKLTDDERKALLISDGERRSYRTEVEKVLPRLAMRFFGESSSVSGIEINLRAELGFLQSPAAPRTGFPLELWLLLEPQDGYFRLTKGTLDLDELGPSPSSGRNPRSPDLLELTAKDPAAFRVAFAHDPRAAVDLEETGFVVWLSGEDGREKSKLRRFAAVVVEAQSPSILGLPKTPGHLGWTVLALAKDDLEPFRKFLKLMHEHAVLGPAKAEEEAARSELFKELLRETFPEATSAIEDQALRRAPGLEFTFPLCFTASPDVSDISFPLSISFLFDTSDAYFVWRPRTVTLEKGRGCSDQLSGGR